LREGNPLGMITRGQRHKPRACQRQRHKPRTCQSMVNTVQVDGLARITGLSGSYSTTHPQPPNVAPLLKKTCPRLLIGCVGTSWKLERVVDKHLGKSVDHQVVFLRYPFFLPFSLNRTFHTSDSKVFESDFQSDV